jgi:hypothetical protein
MAKGSSVFAAGMQDEESLVNIGDPWPGLDEAEMRVLATGEKAAPLGEDRSRSTL